MFKDGAIVLLEKEIAAIDSRLTMPISDGEKQELMEERKELSARLDRYNRAKHRDESWFGGYDDAI